VEANEVVDFPMDGDLFCTLRRAIPDSGAPLNPLEGWEFEEYGICTEYHVDINAKPYGKWLWFGFISLSTFPPRPSSFRLQPPHVAKGRFMDASRTIERRIMRLPTEKEALLALMKMARQDEEPDAPSPEPNSKDAANESDGSDDLPDNVIRFPGSQS